MWKFIFIVFFSSHIDGVVVENGIADDLLLESRCNMDDDCRKFGPAFCNTDHICECRRDAFVYNDPQNSTCMPKASFIGDECEMSKQCSYIPNVDAECFNHTCVSVDALSSPPWTSSSGYCTETSGCPNDHICMSGFCISPTGIPVVETPETLLGTSCANDTDCELEGTACIVSLCQCDKGFVPSQNFNSCLPKAKSPGDPCTESSQCVSLNRGVCENQKCKDIVIVPDLVRTVASAIPRLLIGSTCQTNEECKHLSNSTCSEHVCQCTEGYVTSVSSNSCLPKAKSEGDPCEIDKQCESVKGSVCSKGKCVKDAIAGTKIEGNSGHMPRPMLLAGAFVIIKMFFV